MHIRAVDTPLRDQTTRPQKCLLKHEESDAACFGGRPEAGSDVMFRDGNTRVQMMGRGKRLNHRRRHGTSSISVSLLQRGH